MSNCSRDVELNACNVQNSPPNKCIPSILDDRSKKKNTTQQNYKKCIFSAKCQKKRHEKHIVYF